MAIYEFWDGESTPITRVRADDIDQATFRAVTQPAILCNNPHEDTRARALRIRAAVRRGSVVIKGD